MSQSGRYPVGKDFNKVFFKSLYVLVVYVLVNLVTSKRFQISCNDFPENLTLQDLKVQSCIEKALINDGLRVSKVY